MDEKSLDLATLQALSSRMGRERWRVLSDAAQVVANYLACHPRVEAVRYPGLKADPDFPRAANELVGGFGPYVAYRAAGEWRLWEADDRDAREQVMELEMRL
ncbi:PLP-dependent transferase [Thermophilibacter provencensis]|uniref:PLP-dependent transferase n=1 Tax=Thermophilibacter provencensis TaxID=1852386 RepID=UPI003AA80771